MPADPVIADVSRTLQSVLTLALQPLGAVTEISNLQGNISTNPARLTIFLFEAVEDASARNRPHRIATVPPNVTRRKPDMALLLRYMFTPWGGDRITEHQILGRAMQALYDHAVLSGDELQGVLRDRVQNLKITLVPLTLEERARVWYAIQQPYRLSVTYEVRVVDLDTQVTETLTPVGQRSTNILGPEAANWDPGIPQ